MASYGKGTDVLNKNGEEGDTDLTIPLICRTFFAFFQAFQVPKLIQKHLLEIGFVEFPVVSLFLSFIGQLTNPCMMYVRIPPLSMYVYHTWLG